MKNKKLFVLFAVIVCLVIAGLAYFLSIDKDIPTKTDTEASVVLGTYYVSNTGKDTNNGTSKSTPFKTIAKNQDMKY